MNTITKLAPCLLLALIAGCAGESEDAESADSALTGPVGAAADDAAQKARRALEEAIYDGYRSEFTGLEHFSEVANAGAYGVPIGFDGPPGRLFQWQLHSSYVQNIWSKLRAVGLGGHSLAVYESREIGGVRDIAFLDYGDAIHPGQFRQKWPLLVCRDVRRAAGPTRAQCFLPGR